MPTKRREITPIRSSDDEESESSESSVSSSSNDDNDDNIIRANVVKGTANGVELGSEGKLHVLSKYFTMCVLC